MIKMMELIEPVSGISEQQFHDHWRHPHATLARLVRPVNTYRQNHHLPPPYPQIDSRGYRGVAEARFDSLAVAHGLADDPMFLDHLLPDEFRFIHRETISLTFCREEILWNAVRSQHDYAPDHMWSERERPIYIKLLQFARRADAAIWAAQDLADLARQMGALRCVRLTSVEDESEYAGVGEFAWPTLSAFEAGTRDNQAALNAVCGLPSAPVIMLAQSELVI